MTTQSPASRIRTVALATIQALKDSRPRRTFLAASPSPELNDAIDRAIEAMEQLHDDAQWYQMGGQKFFQLMKEQGY